MQVGVGWAFVAITAVQAVTSAAMLGVGRRDFTMRRVLPFLVSGAAGVLLATACLDLLPEAVQAAGHDSAMWNVLLCTLLALFCVQACAHWLSDRALDAGANQHEALPHDGMELPPLPRAGGSRQSSAGTLLLGSGLHSMVDGVAIAAAFAAGWRPGWSATLAVGLHELPHRLGDFALLLHMGVKRNRAAGAAIGAGAMALVGAAGVAAFGHSAASVPWLLPVSAGSFLYIALVDLLPQMRASRRPADMWWQLACLCGGAALMAVAAHIGGDGL